MHSLTTGSFLGFIGVRFFATLRRRFLAGRPATDIGLFTTWFALSEVLRNGQLCGSGRMMMMVPG